MNSSLNFEVANTIYNKITDGTHDSPKQKESGKPLITSKHIKGRDIDFEQAYLISEEDYDKINMRSKVEQWDVIVSMIGEYCGFCYIERNEIINYAVKNVGLYKTGSKLEAEWLYYYLISPIGKAYLNSVKSGSSQPYLTLGGLRKLPILYPIKLNQRKVIVDILSSLDDKIDLNNKVNKELEALAKTIYEYWFVQFDFPDANGKPYKASGGEMVYNEKLKKEIPEDWQDKTISDWIEKDKSGDWGKESEEGNYTEKVSCIRGADINGLNGNGQVNAPERFILEKNTHKLLEEGDLIIEISGGSPTQSTGRMAFITQETLERFENPLICSNFCKAVSLKDETYLYNFVYQWQRLYDAGVLFGWEGKTSGIKNLLFESFVTNYKTVFPKKDIVEKFYEKVKPLHAKKQKNLQENQKLAELRDWLLPLLMNGQVTVKEAQEHINQAAEPQENYSLNSK